MTFAENCRKYRTALKLTQEQVACAVGISKRTYVYYETGKKMPRKLDTVKKLADLFHIEINELMIIDDEQYLELKRKRPADERANEIITELCLLLENDSASITNRLAIAASIKNICTEFELKHQKAVVDDAPNNHDL